MESAPVPLYGPVNIRYVGLVSPVAQMKFLAELNPGSDGWPRSLPAGVEEFAQALTPWGKGDTLYPQEEISYASGTHYDVKSFNNVTHEGKP